MGSEKCLLFFVHFEVCFGLELKIRFHCLKDIPSVAVSVSHKCLYLTTEREQKVLLKINHGGPNTINVEAENTKMCFLKTCVQKDKY